VTRIAINEALMMLRHKRAYTPLPEASYADPESPFVLNLADRAPTPEQTLAANELRAALNQAVADLGRTCDPSFCSANFKDSRTRRPPNVSV
jgi:hypothetical protein